MKPFTRKELSTTVLILILILGLSLYNFKQAIRRSRDNVRKDDITYLRNQMLTFRDKAGYIPYSTDDGRIRACAPGNIDQLIAQLKEKKITMKDYLQSLEPCEWGNSKLIDYLSETSYADNIPRDPLFDEGLSYRYVSNGKFFQFYAHLEGEDEEVEVDDAIIRLSISCGSELCNYGKTYDQVPLDKSLEEYENELRELNRSK